MTVDLDCGLQDEIDAVCRTESRRVRATLACLLECLGPAGVALQGAFTTAAAHRDYEGLPKSSILAFLARTGPAGSS